MPQKTEDLNRISPCFCPILDQLGLNARYNSSMALPRHFLSIPYSVNRIPEKSYYKRNLFFFVLSRFVFENDFKKINMILIQMVAHSAISTCGVKLEIPSRHFITLTTILQSDFFHAVLIYMHTLFMCCHLIKCMSKKS